MKPKIDPGSIVVRTTNGTRAYFIADRYDAGRRGWWLRRATKGGAPGKRRGLTFESEFGAGWEVVRASAE